MTHRHKADRRRPTGAALSLAIILVCAAFSPLLAKNNAFRETAHGNREQGPHRIKELQRGACVQCHEGHATHNAGPGGNGAGLFAPNDNELCFACHAEPSESGAFPGSATWSRSSHATEPGAVRRARSAAEANLCVNCHDPHGVRDATGVIPSLLSDRETTLCVDCHDGDRAVDVKSQLVRPYVHGARAAGQGGLRNGEGRRALQITSGPRSIGCSDCHNVHVASSQRSRQMAPEAQDVLSGVSRVEVTNGAAGTIPSYRYRAGNEAGPANEYEICFKCHSSWAELPIGKPDLARLTNPRNPSTHPIQQQGKDTSLSPESFTDSWSVDSIVYCADCHGSDDEVARGPHGSSFPYLLKRHAATSSERQRASRRDLCFACHSFEVYADASSPELLLRASRFNSPATAGHAFHVGTQEIPCYSCHDAHGSTLYGSLIVVGRSGGLTSFAQTPNGGTCTSGCHQARTYTINYRR